MKKLLLMALAVGATVVAMALADAAQGCGRGFYRGYHGRSMPNGPGVVVGPRVGVFYPGRGYWYSGRY